MRQLPIALAALALALPLAAPTAAATYTPGLEASVGAQSIGGAGLVGTFDFKADLAFAELATQLRLAPNFTSFLYGDLHIDYPGHLGQYLPLLGGLSTVVGMGLGTVIRDVTAANGKTDTDLGIYLFMPIGLRYRLPFAGLAAEGTYTLPALSSSRGDLSRWRFQVSGELPAISWGLYYEAGPVLNGPGARIGLRF